MEEAVEVFLRGVGARICIVVVYQQAWSRVGRRVSFTDWLLLFLCGLSTSFSALWCLASFLKRFLDILFVFWG